MEMNHLETTKLLSRIAALFPSARFPDDADEAWHDLLGQYPAAAVLMAFDTLARRDPTFPPNAYQIAAEIDAALSGERPVEVIWAELMQIVAKIGNPDYKTAGLREIRAMDPLAADVIENGITWFALASTPIDRNDSLYRRFRDGLTDARKAAKQQATREAVTAVAPGMNGHAIGAGR
jgi:hypothetical protein